MKQSSKRSSLNIGQGTTPVRVLAWLGFSFGGGTFLAGVLPEGGALLALGCAAAAAGVLALLRRKEGLRSLLCALGLCLGLLWQSGYAHWVVEPMTALAGSEDTFSATVVGIPVTGSYDTVCVTADVKGVGRVNLYLPTDPWVEPGDTLTGTAVYHEAVSSSAKAEGVFLWAKCSDIIVTGSVHTPNTWPGRAAAAIQRTLTQLFSGETLGLYQALLTGDRSLLPASLSTSLERCGLSHIVAVSGMHLGILAALLFVLLPRGKGRLLALPVLLFFTVMVGSLSAWRALLMEGLYLLAPLVRRRSDGLTSLAFALVIILLSNPLAVFARSLQLSFGAMVGISLLASPIYHGLTRLGQFIPGKGTRLAGLGNGLAGLVSTTLAASAFTIPLTAWYVRQISLISLAANVLVVWLLPPALVLGLAAVAVTQLCPVLATGAAVLPWLVAQGILRPVRWMSRWSFAALTLSDLPRIAWFVLLLAVAVLIVLCPGLRKRPLLPLGAVAGTLAAILLLGRLAVADTAVTIQVVDVGQGQGILLLSQGQAAAVDCGGSGYDSAGDLLADGLQGLGISRLDTLYITHFDSDHCNGAEELFARIQVDTLVIPAVAEEEGSWRDTLLALAEEQGTQVVALEETAIDPLGSGTLTVYPPADLTGGNNGGLALLGQFGNFRMLITGDMDSDGERILQARYHLPDVDLLIAGHHGSKYAASQGLLDAVTPETAVISVGDNSYGHPADETVARLQQAGVDVYRTDENGTITLQVGG